MVFGFNDANVMRCDVRSCWCDVMVMQGSCFKWFYGFDVLEYGCYGNMYVE